MNIFSSNCIRKGSYFVIKSKIGCDQHKVRYLFNGKDIFKSTTPLELMILHVT